MAAPAFVFATPVFLPAADACESSAGESASSSPLVETDVVDAFRLSALALPPAFLLVGGAAEVPSDQYSSSVDTSEKSGHSNAMSIMGCIWHRRTYRQTPACSSSRPFSLPSASSAPCLPVQSWHPQRSAVQAHRRLAPPPGTLMSACCCVVPLHRIHVSVMRLTAKVR